MKKFPAILIALAVLGAGTAGAQETREILDGVAAIVNSNVITFSQVREFVQPVIQQLRREYSGQELMDKVRAAQMDALNNLIDRSLIIQEFNTKGYSIPESVIEQQINEIIAADYAGDRTAFTKTLQAQKLTLSQYREKIRERTIVQAMRNRKTQQEVVVSPYKIEQYYKAHLADFKVEEQIKLRLIYIKKAPPSEAIATTNTVATTATGTNEPPTTVAPPAPPVDVRRQLGEDVVAKLDAGAKFADLAKQFSDGKEAQQGGDWGWVGKDALRKELNEVAFTLKPGEHSKLIDTKEGYYVIQVDDHKAAYTKPLRDIQESVEKLLLQQQRATMQEKWVKELRDKAFIKLF